MHRLFIRLMLILTLSLGWALGVWAQEVQSDWSGGPGSVGPVGALGAEFALGDAVSWLTIKGQVGLSGTALASTGKTLLASGLDGAFGLEAADFDGDGDVDIVATAEYDRSLTLWDNNGDFPPTFTASTLDADYQDVAAVFAIDIDGDMDLDLVASSGNRYGRVTCYLNDGNSPVAWTAEDVDSSWGEAWEIAAGDVDGDGHTDVVGTSLTGAEVVWWRNDGQTPIGWTRETVAAGFNGAHSARPADFDGDGHMDILACGTTSNQVAWWRNSGTSPITWTKTIIDGLFFGGRSVRTGDIDGDGDLDAAAVGFNGRVQWWRNEGGTPLVWDSQIVDTTLSNNHQLQLGDINGDGRMDLVAASYGSNVIAWWENVGGTPTTWTRHLVDYQLARPLALDIGDLDGDGALEIIGSSNTGDLIRWYEPTEFVAAGTLTSSILDAGSAPGEIGWTATTPAGTAVHFQVRGADDAGDLGAWSADITTPGALGGGLGRYVQYRAFLASNDPGRSPLLHEVSFLPTVSAVLPSPGKTNLRTFPNPANPRVMVAFDLPRQGPVLVEVFDLRGRRVRVLADSVLAATNHQLTWNGDNSRGQAVATGIYQVRLRTAQGISDSRVTLVR